MGGARRPGFLTILPEPFCKGVRFFSVFCDIERGVPVFTCGIPIVVHGLGDGNAYKDDAEDSHKSSSYINCDDAPEYAE